MISGRQSASGGETTRERGLLAGGGVTVHDALRHRFVEGANGLGDGSPERITARRARGLDRGADLRADGTVAHTPLLALANALHGRLRVRHFVNPPWPVDGHRASCRTSPAISNAFSRTSS